MSTLARGYVNRTLVMAVLNVTPDSFSDGGHWFHRDQAIARGQQLIAQGADLLDVGGESTRPGADRATVEEELRRVVPVVEALSPSIPVSVDTMRAEVARAAIRAGATIINDVSGGLADPSLPSVVADSGVDYVCQHWRGHGAVMNTHAKYADVVTEVRDELMARVRAVVTAGVARERVIIDPGIGFAKNSEHNWAVLANLQTYLELGQRTLVGASRKRFLAEFAVGDHARDRDAATAALTMHCAQLGVWAVRTHEVPANLAAVRVAARLAQERRSPDLQS